MARNPPAPTSESFRTIKQNAEPVSKDCTGLHVAKGGKKKKLRNPAEKGYDLLLLAALLCSPLFRV